MDGEALSRLACLALGTGSKVGFLERKGIHCSLLLVTVLSSDHGLGV